MRIKLPKNPTITRGQRTKRQEQRFKREMWLAWASEPLPHYKITARRVRGLSGERICTLEVEGLETRTWRAVDVPWLYEFLQQVLPRLHGAWHVARSHRPVATGAKKSGEQRGKQISKTAAAHQALIDRTVNYLRQTDPSAKKIDLAQQLKDRKIPGTLDSLVKKIKGKPRKRLS